MLLCACIYVRKHFRRSFSSFSFGPMRRSGTEKQRFPYSRRIAGSTRETRFLSVARCLISRYICAVSLCRRAFHVNHTLISCMLPSGDTRGRNAHLYLLVMRLIVNATILSPCHNHSRKCGKIKRKRDNL